MVVPILKYAIRGIMVSRISILLQKKKTVRAGTRNGQNLNTDLIICVYILTHRKENVK